MSEDNSFEIINNKSDRINVTETDSATKDVVSASLVSGVVPPPSALPTFVTSTESLISSSSNMFHSNTFSPEIPENKTKTEEILPEDNFKYESNNDSITAVGSSLLGWVKDTVGNKGSNLLNKVAEKAKSSVGSVITTLDPQMKDFISSSHDYELIITSEKEVVVSSVREAFQSVFNRISVRGLGVEDQNFARQLVGFESASKAAFYRIEAIRNQHSMKGPIVAVQSFVTEISEEKWYDLDLIVLHDLEKDMQLETYSQMIPIPTSIVNLAREDTPKDYEYINTGFSIPVSQIMGNNLQVHSSEWQETLTGVTRRQRIFSAAKVLANLYKNTLL